MARTKARPTEPAGAPRSDDAGSEDSKRPERHRRRHSTERPRALAADSYLAIVGVIVGALAGFFAQSPLLGVAVIILTAGGAILVTSFRRYVPRPRLAGTSILVIGGVVLGVAIASIAGAFAAGTGGVAEVTGGTAATWSDYTTAGGEQGTQLPANARIHIQCRLIGFRVHDGNRWWYRIADKPWDGHFYASADSFYNNGKTSGSLKDTPFYDHHVPVCPTGS